MFDNKIAPKHRNFTHVLCNVLAICNKRQFKVVLKGVNLQLFKHIAIISSSREKIFRNNLSETTTRMLNRCFKHVAIVILQGKKSIEII